MPHKFHLSFSIEDDIIAEDIEEAWDTIKERMEDRFYGPTVKDVEDLGYVEEEEEE